MSFELYLTFEFFAAFSTTGIVGTCFVYNMEWITAKYRVILNCIATLTDASSALFIGLAAWYFEANFNAYKLAMAVPGFLVILLFFVLRESPRWLLAQHKYARAIRCISHAAKINGRSLHSKTIEHFRNQPESAFKATTQRVSDDQSGEHVTLLKVLQQKALAFRLFILTLVWFFSVFAYYGIVLASKNAHENKYVSYIVVGLAEIPGSLLTIVIMNRMGRRMSIGMPLLVYGLVLIVSTQLPPKYQILQLLFFIIGRASITLELIALFTYTTELWPTSIRNTALNICSMIARIGSILASLSVLLAKYYVHLPTILYGLVGIISSVLLFAFLPETMHCTKLPETIEETIAIGTDGKPQAVERDQVI